ncbi:MAG: hypothetical protein EPN91_07395 [Salinibacterium sp.]|nr:MAG: hypothetical protein EPN91_07395 [Salinibacterium sp.]
MARQERSVQIGADAYRLRQLGATEGLVVYSKLLKVLGPMIRAAIAEPLVASAAKPKAIPANPGTEQPASDEASPELLDLSDSAGMKIASIVIQGIENLETSLLQELCDKFARCTSCQLEPGGPMVEMAGDIFDSHFAGRYTHLTKWLLAHLQLNFADFLVGKKGSASPSPAG